MHQLEFFFDCSSPWTYLAFEQMLQKQLDNRTQLIWRPILVGGVFNSVNPSVYENRANPVPAKQRYYKKDLDDWARFVGLNIGTPPVFPVNSVKVMRGAFLALEQDRIVPYARAFFSAYWSELKDISQEGVIAEVLTEIGMDPQEFAHAIQQDHYKQQLRSNTDELIARGGFGSPTFFLDEQDMYFGNDRLTLIEARLQS
ncbi:MAG: 2-hydroxychromene-2-carboxylate isomerase [Pseudomonadales bacterium]